MAFKTDHGGMALRADIKVAKHGSTWGTRLSQISKCEGEITLCTYSLSRDTSYLSRILDKRSANVTIIANVNFAEQARALKENTPRCGYFCRKAHMPKWRLSLRARFGFPVRTLSAVQIWRIPSASIARSHTIFARRNYSGFLNRITPRNWRL